MSYPHAVFGAGGIGATPGSFIYTWDDPEAVSELLELLAGVGVTELDSAASYPPGNPWRTETLLGQAKSFDGRFILDSKIEVLREGGSLAAKHIGESIAKTLELVGRAKVRTLYAHAADSTTRLEETAAAFHEVYQKGLCERIGLSNYSVADMKRYLDICEKNGYQKPSVYQDQYNALERSHEAEMFPLLRKHNIKFYAYSPLAGGFLSGKITFAKNKDDPNYAPIPEKTRWDGPTKWQRYPDLFDHEPIHAAIRRLNDACQKESIKLADASLRWLMYHSALKDGDGVILGATKLEQVKSNAGALKQGPLPKSVADAVEQLHQDTKEYRFTMF